MNPASLNWLRNRDLSSSIAFSFLCDQGSANGAVAQNKGRVAVLVMGGYPGCREAAEELEDGYGNNPGRAGGRADGANGYHA
jgi:hypothetical protein